jgi:hypothetical protein
LPALSEEQQKVFDLVMAGKSVFFTGCAGKQFIQPKQYFSTLVADLTAFMLLASPTPH